MKYLLLTLLALSVNSYSGTDEPHPVIDSNYITKYSYNLGSMDLKELEKTKFNLQNYLDENKSSAIKSKDEINKRLLAELLKYDDVRIQITTVIDEIIEEYNVNEEIKGTLLSFKDTFNNIIKDNRYLVKNLRDYKAYDFRLGSAYLAMMSAFHETEDSRKFYSRLVKDKKNPSTSIGSYNKKLKSSQANINLVKKEMENFAEISDVKNILKKIDQEISNRN